MGFGFYSNMVSQASRGVAKGMFITGLLLVGFGVLILAMPAVFALLAAMAFFIAGVGCAWTAVRIYLAQRHIDRMMQEPDDGRINVRIHHDDDLGA